MTEGNKQLATDIEYSINPAKGGKVR